jgi:multiple sugar transport system substrate-binding protein
MSLRNRRQTLAALGAVGLGAAVGCRSADPAAAGRTAIRFSGYAGNPAETDLVRKLVADFNASQRDVHVVYEPVPGQYYPKMLTMLVADTAPDVFYLDIVYFKPFLSKNILRPMDDLMRASGMDREAFLPSLINAFSQDGQVWGIPKDFNALALFYNRALFEKAGEELPTADWDLERLRQAAKRLSVGGASGFALTHDDADRYLPIARKFGAELFGPDGRCTLASPEAEHAMAYYHGLKHEDRAAIYPAEVGAKWTGDAFGRGAAAMVFEGSWLIPYLRDSFPDLAYGVTQLPRGPMARSNFLFTVAYVIPKACKNVEAAWKLIEFLTSEASQAQVTFALPSRGSISARYASEHAEYQSVLDGAGYAQPFEFGKRGDRVKDRLGVMVQEVFLGAKTGPKALADAAKDIDRLTKL